MSLWRIHAELWLGSPKAGEEMRAGSRDYKTKRRVTDVQ
jgi:hypothetical protein